MRGTQYKGTWLFAFLVESKPCPSHQVEITCRVDGHLQVSLATGATAGVPSEAAPLPPTCHLPRGRYANPEDSGWHLQPHWMAGPCCHCCSTACPTPQWCLPGCSIRDRTSMSCQIIHEGGEGVGGCGVQRQAAPPCEGESTRLHRQWLQSLGPPRAFWCIHHQGDKENAEPPLLARWRS